MPLEYFSKLAVLLDTASVSSSKDIFLIFAAHPARTKLSVGDAAAAKHPNYFS